MKAWFLRFSVREQLALLVMAFVVGAYVVAVVLVLPLGEARDDMSARNAATAEALVRVDALASELKTLRDQEGAASSTARGNLTALINRSAERYGMRPSRLQPNSRGAVQVRFEAAALDVLLRWLHDLETTQGLIVEEVSLSQTSATGIVSASTRIAALP